MATSAGPNSVKEGLVFGYDIGYPQYPNNTGTVYHPGRPTTNVSSGYGMSVYNNSGANISISLNAISETFKGATVYRQILTPVTSTGVSHLSGGNNPGVGVVTGGGGGTGGVYTGHSIFFRPSVPMHSSPIYTNYSNIGGWQSSNLYEYVGEGWYRAFVTWYDTVTRSDGKYWAINPQSAVLNRSITIDWAGPFRENLNSPTVTPYVHTSRSATQCLKDFKKNYTLDVSNVSFDSSNTIFFDGSNDYIETNSATIIGGNQDFTIESVYNKTGNTACAIFGNYGPGYTSNHIWFSGAYGIYIAGSVYAPGYPLANGKYHMVATRQAGSVKLYLNGTQVNSGTLVTSVSTNVNYRIGADVNGAGEPFTGNIYTVRVYNRAITATEVAQNYQAYKFRFGI